jgi:hypothetical protein
MPLDEFVGFYATVEIRTTSDRWTLAEITLLILDERG